MIRGARTFGMVANHVTGDRVDEGGKQRVHHAARSRWRSAHSTACAVHRSLFGAGDVVQRLQIGLSQVPLLRVGTFQSHSSVARRPHAQRRLGPHTIARPPVGKVTLEQTIR